MKKSKKPASCDVIFFLDEPGWDIAVKVKDRSRSQKNNKNKRNVAEGPRPMVQAPLEGMPAPPADFVSNPMAMLPPIMPVSSEYPDFSLEDDLFGWPVELGIS